MSTFRIEDGVPWVGDKAYRWARHVCDNEAPWPYQGFLLHTENAWQVSVLWRVADYPAEPEFSPAGMVAAVDAEAIGLHQSLIDHDPEMGSWPHGTPWNWSLPRTYIKGYERLDDIIAEAAKRFSPTWPIESVRAAS